MIAAIKAMQNDLVSMAERQACFEQFLKLGLPHRKIEAFKYTPLNQINLEQFQIPVKSAVKFSQPAIDSFKLIFIDGYLQAAISDQLPDEIIFEKNLIENEKINALDFLNRAFLLESIQLKLQKNKKLTKPLHLIFHNQSAAQIINLQISLTLESSAELDLIVEFSGVGQNNFSNVKNQILLQENAKLNYYSLQHADLNDILLTQAQVNLESAAVFSAWQFALGGKLTREAMQVNLNAKSADCCLQGLYLLNQDQHNDFQLLANHVSGLTNSWQNYRGIVAGNAKAVFNSCAQVERSAKKITARQSNDNILLSEAAEVYTKPELKIYTDDVICHHGATVGQLDEQALFYLRSRGIEKKIARGLILEGFIKTIMANIKPENIFNYMNMKIQQKMQAILIEESVNAH